jgi:hypothetical protein
MNKQTRNKQLKSIRKALKSKNPTIQAAARAAIRSLK